MVMAYSDYKRKKDAAKKKAWDKLSAENERLRAEVQRLAGEVSNRNARALRGDQAQAAFDNLFDEHERLRAVNERLASALVDLLEEAESGLATCPLTRNKARAALAAGRE